MWEFPGLARLKRRWRNTVRHAIISWRRSIWWVDRRRQDFSLRQASEEIQEHFWKLWKFLVPCEDAHYCVVHRSLLSIELFLRKDLKLYHAATPHGIQQHLPSTCVLFTHVESIENADFWAILAMCGIPTDLPLKSIFWYSLLDGHIYPWRAR